MNAKFWKVSKDINYSHVKKPEEVKLSQEERAERHQKFILELQKNAKEYKDRKCLAIGSATILKKIRTSQYRIQYTLTKKTGRCARFGSSTMGGGCTQPEVIQQSREDGVKFLKDPGFKENSFTSLFQ